MSAFITAGLSFVSSRISEKDSRFLIVKGKLITTKDPIFPEVVCSIKSAAAKSLKDLKEGDQFIVVGQLRTGTVKSENGDINKVTRINPISVATASTLVGINSVISLGALGKRSEVVTIANGRSKTPLYTCRRAIIGSDAASEDSKLEFTETMEIDDELGVPKTLLEAGTVVVANVWGQEKAEEFNEFAPGSAVEVHGTLQGSIDRKNPDSQYVNLSIKKVYSIPVGSSREAIAADGERVTAAAVSYEGLDEDITDV